ncbi:MAG: peptidase M14 [Acidobacteria bacterium]|nr:peptidase M14 [Acidobacteriota bacterium]MCI0720340.1 peptidase M14 [Acidobacteriota bacterium]
MRIWLLLLIALVTRVSPIQSLAQQSPPSPLVSHPDTGLEFINTSFENASPLHWEIDTEGAVQIFLVYDQERSSPNRANGHWHFQLEGKPGAKLTLVLNNLGNVWNRKKGFPLSDKPISFVSANGRDWQAIQGRPLPGNRVQFTVEMQGSRLYVARLEPYRLSDLDKLLDTIRQHRLVQLTRIGQTVEGRELEIIRVGSAEAPYRIFLRARAHAWEPGGNWVVQGLIRRLLRDDETVQRYLARYCVYIMAMANKDGVARGRTRFNLLGKDLNRNWDQPADPQMAPENHALETWLETMIKQGRGLHLAIDFHNDNSGQIHFSRPAEGDLERYLARMRVLEDLLRKHTWFTEGSTRETLRNTGEISEGLPVRYGIDALVHELNADWIAGLKDYPFGRNWELYGEQLCRVFYEYFNAIKP